MQKRQLTSQRKSVNEVDLKPKDLRFRMYEGQTLVNVPPFLKEGEQVIVTTERGDQYIMKVWKKGKPGQVTLLNIGKLEMTK